MAVSIKQLFMNRYFAKEIEGKFFLCVENTMCPECGNEENFHTNYDYSKKEMPIIDIICNECGGILMDYKILGEMSGDAHFLLENNQEIKLTDLNPLSAATIEHNETIKYPIRIKHTDGKYY